MRWIFFIILIVINNCYYAICDIMKMKNFSEQNLSFYDNLMCTVQCTKELRGLEECYTRCDTNQYSLVGSAAKLKPSAVRFTLLCRQSTKLTLEIAEDIKQISQSNALYLVETFEIGGKHSIYVSNSIFVTIDALQPRTVYNVTATVLDDNFKDSSMHESRFWMPITTLDANYIPGNIIDIFIENFVPNSQTNLLNVMVVWKPAADRSCHYELYIHEKSSNAEEDLKHIQINHPEKPYRQLIEKLKFGTQYAVGIVGINDYRNNLQSSLAWRVITTPTCLQWYKNDLNQCAPNHPENIQINPIFLSPNNYNINITWDDPLLHPNSYLVEINDFEGRFVTTQHLDGRNHNILMRDVPIHGTTYGLTLTAFSGGGNSTTSSILNLNQVYAEQTRKFEIYKTLLYGGLPLSILLVTILMYLICKCRQTKLDRMECRIQYFEELEQKSPVEPDIIGLNSSESFQNIILKSNYSIDENYNFFDDQMEIPNEQIELQEKIGEGAFGYVRRGYLSPDRVEVAVKMLKDSPSLDEIKQFYKEIDVMKSVAKHPNILGIKGHSTKNILDMMLVTEYCSEGNLLDFLRNIWYRLQSQSDQSCVTPALAASKAPDLFVNNFGYEFNEYDSPTANPSLDISFLDLISFAEQIATGMEFLARNKVIHRDLAARNILVCKDKTIKIADFGLSRDIYKDNMYRKFGNGKLPIKWLAIESLTHQMYTSQSDVWSFGVLLYEIVTLGSSPYPSVEASDLLGLLKLGYRMDRPNNCCPEIYSIMLSCWNTLPSDRPTFTELKSAMNKLQDNNDCHINALI